MHDQRGERAPCLQSYTPSVGTTEYAFSAVDVSGNRGNTLRFTVRVRHVAPPGGHRP
jgi:hypothetical protein